MELANDFEREENYCGKCGKFLEEGDKYCMRCGTKRGEGSFDPMGELMQCIYGPMPVRRKHNCGFCSNRWESFDMLDRANYCPKCGKNDVTTESDEDFDW